MLVVKFSLKQNKKSKNKFYMLKQQTVTKKITKVVKD